MTIVDSPGGVKLPGDTMAEYVDRITAFCAELAAVTLLPPMHDLAAEVPYEPGYPTPGRDCQACPADRGEHDGWGCARTGCKLSVALVTRSLYRRTT